MSNKKEIIYPIFLECLEYIDNIFWENIFEDLAYGKAPYGTFFSKNFLCCNQKNKEFIYKLEKKCAEEIYREVYDILKNKFGLLSETEKIKKKKIFVQFENELKESRNKWSDIRKKNIKDSLIENYVLKMKKKHSLSYKQSKKVLSIIFISMIFKIITSKDILYSNNEIEHINGFIFSNKKFSIDFNMYNMENSTLNIENDKKYMFNLWEKYIKELDKLSF